MYNIVLFMEDTDEDYSFKFPRELEEGEVLFLGDKGENIEIISKFYSSNVSISIWFSESGDHYVDVTYRAKRIIKEEANNK